MKVILLRHGESIDDVLNCYGGAADYDLSEAGKKTAEDVAKLLCNEKIDAIYSSPLKRAFQTAQAVESYQNCGVQIAAGLYERNSYGVMSGTNIDECKVIFGYLLKDIKGKVGNYYSDELVLGAEPVVEFDLRVKNAFIAVVDDATSKGYETIAIVTHGNVTRSLYKNVLKVSGKIDLDLLAITRISVDHHNFTIEDSSGITIKDA